MSRIIASPDVFVSYSWKDSKSVLPFVDSLLELLRSTGIQIFFDRDSRPLNDPDALKVGLASGLSTARIFLPCASWSYLDSKWCVKELTAFFLRYLSENTIATEQKQTSGFRLATSLPLYCLPVALGCDDPYEAIHDFEKLELALLGELIDKSKDIEIIRKFLSSGKALIYRAGLEPMELARQVGSYIENLLEHSSNDRRKFSPNLLWKRLWELYEFPKLGESVNPVVLLGGFSITSDVILKTKTRIDSHADEGLVELFVSVARGRDKCVAFDRWNQISTSNENRDRLTASSMCGDPIVLLVSQVRNHPMLHALQYSYYSFVSLYGQDELVDVCAVASLAMNIHSWYEGIDGDEAIRASVLSPLSEGTDIARYIA